MTTLTTSLEPRSEAFRANAAAMRGVVEELRAQTATISLGVRMVPPPSKQK